MVFVHFSLFVVVFRSSFFLYAPSSTTITSNNGAITKFYNNPKVQDALNVGEHRTWKSCSGQDNGRHLLSNDRPLSMLPYIADLLDDAGIEVLIYNGDRDLLANQPGSEMALNHMQWSGAKGWADVEVFQRGLWVDSPKSVGGYIKTYKNLHLLSVYNSGHMVPYNRPLLALDLITRFINGTSFMDAPIPSFKARYFERAKEGIDDDDFHFYYKFVIAPLILVLGICIGMCITRHRHRKYEGYDELGPAATLS